MCHSVEKGFYKLEMIKYVVLPTNWTGLNSLTNANDPILGK